MALTYVESDELMKDAAFRGRVRVGLLKYAAFILDEPGSTPAHNTRSQWARNTMQAPDVTAQQMTPPVVMDAAVQDAGASITDEALQTTVETTVNKLM